MKKISYSVIIVLCVSLQMNAQNFIDKYLTDPLTYTTIGTTTNNINQPKDLEFKPNTNELWVVNYGTSNGGETVIFYNAGQTNQTSQFRKDSHTSHFMRQASSLAFGDNGEWASTGEIQNSNGSSTSTFMGPSLWSSDTSIFARVFQNAWVSGQPLGSHLDMLHQSPMAMGIAHDSAKIYWVFDGWNGNICKYDYVSDHSPGYDNHSAGKIWRYTDVLVQRTVGIPSHMVLDKTSGWLYIVDNGNNRLIRINTNTGTVAGPLTPPSTANEALAGYWSVTGITQQTISTGISEMCGVDYYNNRLIVSNYTTGDILVYNTTTPTPTLLGTIVTGQPGIMGVKIGPDGKIWFVNNLQNTVVRINPLPATIDASVLEITSPLVQNYEPKFYSPKFNICAASVVPVVTLQNKGSNTLTSVTINYTIDGGSPATFNWTGSLATGATASVTLPSTAIISGTHKIVAYTSNPNGLPDQNMMNDTKEGSFRSVNPIVSLPFLQDFTPAIFPPVNWSYIGYNKYCYMSRIATVGGFGTGLGCLKMDNYSGSVNIAPQKDYFLSPRIDLSSAPTNTTLDFDVAYRRYDNTSVDQLEVMVSTDCGVTWTSVYNKSGLTLSTAPNGTTLFVPTATQWRTENISLSAYAGQPDVMFMFTSTSDWGNNFYIDNIRIPVVTDIKEQNSETNVSIFPNPSTGIFAIETEMKEFSISVYDAIGNIIYEGKNERTIDISSQAKGIYFVKISSGDKIVSKKIVLE